MMACLWEKNKKLVDSKKALCMQKWECCGTDTVTEFLGMCVTQTASTVTINQCKYLEKVLEHFDMTNDKIASTPGHIVDLGQE